MGQSRDNFTRTVATWADSCTDFLGLLRNKIKRACVSVKRRTRSHASAASNLRSRLSRRASMSITYLEIQGGLYFWSACIPAASGQWQCVYVAHKSLQNCNCLPRGCAHHVNCVSSAWCPLDTPNLHKNPRTASFSGHCNTVTACDALEYRSVLSNVLCCSLALASQRLAVLSG